MDPATRVFPTFGTDRIHLVSPRPNQHSDSYSPKHNGRVAVLGPAAWRLVAVQRFPLARAPQGVDNGAVVMALTPVFPAWITLIALLVLVAVVLWANQREQVLQASEERAGQAESRAATAEAVVTAQAQIQAATATALAYTNSPAAAVSRSLSVVLAAEKEPTDQRLRALNDTFGPAALSVVRPEVEHLLSGGLHLGGDSSYDLSIVTTTAQGPDEAQVQTHEVWTYDERGSDDHRARCLIETSEQTYILQKPGTDWQVADIQLGTTSRADCPGP